MNLASLKETWDTLGKRDPFGAILDPLKGRDDWDLDEFFASGRAEVDAVVGQGSRFALPRERRAALDFGCGAGRLTQAMAERFEEAVGVDIAPSMVELARGLNRHPERCRYELNESASLPFADRSFDFVYSNITLQHIEPPLTRCYLAELVRVLRPGGLLVFQLPSERDTVSALPWSAFKARIEPYEQRLQLVPGAERTLKVRVRNLGDTLWPADLPRRPLRLGNHWRDVDDDLVALDDGRAQLPHDVLPGGEADFSLPIRAPAVPGEYVLELDVVQEGTAWFADRGSQPARLHVDVRAEADNSGPRRRAFADARKGSRWRDLSRRLRARRPPREDATAPEMHGIPEPEVQALLERAGAEVLDVVEDDAAGPGWISLRYTATRNTA